MCNSQPTVEKFDTREQAKSRADQLVDDVWSIERERLNNDHALGQIFYDPMDILYYRGEEEGRVFIKYVQTRGYFLDILILEGDISL